VEPECTVVIYGGIRVFYLVVSSDGVYNGATRGCHEMTSEEGSDLNASTEVY
jgi:hypothetical protein